MEQGRVKWFNNKKGYGFILDNKKMDVMVHHTVIDMEGFASLSEGQEVDFEANDTDTGRRATYVSIKKMG